MTIRHNTRRYAFGIWGTDGDTIRRLLPDAAQRQPGTLTKVGPTLYAGMAGPDTGILVRAVRSGNGSLLIPPLPLLTSRVLNLTTPAVRRGTAYTTLEDHTVGQTVDATELVGIGEYRARLAQRGADRYERRLERGARRELRREAFQHAVYQFFGGRGPPAAPGYGVFAPV